MIIMEYTSGNYERLMEFVSCIEKKAKAVKEMLEDEREEYQPTRRRSRYDSRYDS